ncbi:MAG: alpha-L-rhamnosidase C-terminal domain-containing protein [Microbacterium sp.]|uniref:alpha-L-rhamnosidase C-terminal domain-containing protein n=1 Tax=Microbacterium sp. TaxID=51671 RepID=UPI0039E703B9
MHTTGIQPVEQGCRIAAAAAVTALMTVATLLASVPAHATSVAAETGTTYYVDSSCDGCDTNSGTSPDEPWQTLDAVNAHVFEMTSFNHYALGAVADWLHRRVAGLAAAAPGWREVRVAPLPGGGITSAQAAHVTPFGRAEVSWSIDGGEFTLQATIPEGVVATVHLPSGAEPVRVGAGRHVFTETRDSP